MSSRVNPWASASASTRVVKARNRRACLVWRPRVAGAHSNERPNSAARFEDPTALEIRVHPGNGIGVDAQLDGKLADRRQLIAGAKAAGGNGGPERALELRVDWRAIAGVNRNDHLAYYTSSLVQVIQAISHEQEERHDKRSRY